jgi:ABC-type branched-subunit amino acid transport system substrate-binding protein
VYAVTDPISEEVFADSSEWIEAQQVTASAYDSVWLIAEAWAKALQALSAAAIRDTNEGGPVDADVAGAVRLLFPPCAF